MRAGLARAALLPTGTGLAELTAGLVKPWGGELDAFVRAELGWHPAEALTGLAFAQADRLGLTAGVGARVTF